MKLRNDHKPKIKKIHSKFFYYPCCNCGVAFKDTDMWKLDSIEAGMSSMIKVSRYCCSSCAKDEDSAIKLLMDPDDYKTYINTEIQIKKLEQEYKETQKGE